MTEEREQRRISRRTIAKGAAWAVPAVPLVVATPAYAASGGGPDVDLGDACKLPGNSCGDVFVKGYIFDVTITNNTDKPLYLYNEPGYLITFTEDSPDISLFFQAAVDATTGQVITFPYLINPGQQVFLIFNAGENGNSQNVQDLTLTISIPWGHTPDPADDPDIATHVPATDTDTYASTPPIQNPSCAVVLPPNCAEIGAEIGPVQLTGLCGVTATLDPPVADAEQRMSFSLTPGSAAVPAGSTITVTANREVIQWSVRGAAGYTQVGGEVASTVVFTLTADQPVGQIMYMLSSVRAPLVVEAWQMNAVLQLPAGVSATGGKLTATVSADPAGGCQAG